MQAYSFAPSLTSVPQFQPTLDGNVYNALVKWNTGAQRYYLELYTLGGDLVFSVPVVETSPSISLSSLSWSFQSGRVMALTSSPHNFKLGISTPLSVSGCQPDPYNGLMMADIIGPSSFSYPIANPGMNTVQGSVSFLISMSAGYFTSTIIYRNGQFEVDTGLPSSAAPVVVGASSASIFTLDHSLLGGPDVLG